MVKVGFAFLAVLGLLPSRCVVASLPSNAVDCTLDASVCESSEYCNGGKSADNFCDDASEMQQVNGRFYCMEQTPADTSNWAPATVERTLNGNQQRYCGYPCASIPLFGADKCLPENALDCTDDASVCETTGWCTGGYCFDKSTINGRKYCMEQQWSDVSDWEADTISQVYTPPMSERSYDQRVCGFTYYGRPTGECQEYPLYPGFCIPDNAVDCTDNGKSVCDASAWCGGSSTICIEGDDQVKFDGRSYCWEQEAAATSEWENSTIVNLFAGVTNQRFCGHTNYESESESDSDSSDSIDFDDDVCRTTPGNLDLCIPRGAVECTGNPDVCVDAPTCGSGNEPFCYNNDERSSFEGRVFCFESAPANTFKTDTIYQTQSEDGVEQRICGDYSNMKYPSKKSSSAMVAHTQDILYLCTFFVILNFV